MMVEQPNANETARQRALRDRYPADRQVRDRAAQEDLRALRQGLHDLSDVVGVLVAYLNEISIRIDAGITSEESQNREQLRLLGEEVSAIRESFPQS